MLLPLLEEEDPLLSEEELVPLLLPELPEEDDEGELEELPDILDD